LIFLLCCWASVFPTFIFPYLPPKLTFHFYETSYFSNLQQQVSPFSAILCLYEKSAAAFPAFPQHLRPAVERV